MIRNKEMIAELFEEFKANGGSAGQIVRDTGLSSAYVSKALSGWENYTLSDAKKSEVEAKIKDYLVSKKDFKGSLNSIKSAYKDVYDKAGILGFRNTENIIKSVLKTVKQNALTKICGKSGCGKTTAIKAIMKKLPQMVYVAAYDGMNKKEFLEELALAIGIKSLPKTNKELMRAIKRELGTNKKVIAIDEANFLTEASLEQIRHIHDICELPIILVGTEKLDEIIASSHQQVETRIRASLPIEAVGETEVLMLAASLSINLSDAQIKKLWKRCRNLREIKHWCDDFIEMYGNDINFFEESLA
jgi:DNA transposition AAA+ family ATPase